MRAFPRGNLLQKRKTKLPIDQENPPNSRAPDLEPPAYNFAGPPGTIRNDLPPRTYEESMKMGLHGNENLENDLDSGDKATEFSPLYPAYKFEDGQGFLKMDGQPESTISLRMLTRN